MAEGGEKQARAILHSHWTCPWARHLTPQLPLSTSSGMNGCYWAAPRGEYVCNCKTVPTPCRDGGYEESKETEKSCERLKGEGVRGEGDVFKSWSASSPVGCLHVAGDEAMFVRRTDWVVKGGRGMFWRKEGKGVVERDEKSRSRAKLRLYNLRWLKENRRRGRGDETDDMKRK